MFSFFWTNVIFLKKKYFPSQNFVLWKKKNSENFNSFENNIISVDVAKVLLMIVTRK